METTTEIRTSTGRWWFQNRSLSPIPVLGLVLFLRSDFELTLGLFFIGLLGVVAAETLRIWAVSYAGSSTRTRNDAVPRLVSTGPYRLTRNPLYIANILLYLSFTFLFGHIYLSLVALIYFSLQYSLIVTYEEGLLTSLFGKEYAHYCASVPRWIGFYQHKLTPAHNSFDLKAAIRSERSTLTAIGAVSLLWLTRLLWQRH